MFDDITDIFGEPRYDEYNDDYEVDSSEQNFHFPNMKMIIFNNPKKLANVHMTTVKKMKKVLN
jgi:hypothetical protein